MTLAMGRTTRVIGWYHSHPHITVLPSHVGKFYTNVNSSFCLVYFAFKNVSSAGASMHWVALFFLFLFFICFFNCGLAKKLIIWLFALIFQTYQK